MSAARQSLPLTDNLKQKQQQLSFLSSSDHICITIEEDRDAAKFANQPEETRSTSISPR